MLTVEHPLGERGWPLSLREGENQRVKIGRLINGKALYIVVELGVGDSLCWHKARPLGSHTLRHACHCLVYEMAVGSCKLSRSGHDTSSKVLGALVYVPYVLKLVKVEPTRAGMVMADHLNDP